MTTVNRQKLKDTLIGELARLPPTDQMWADIFESLANLVDPNTFQGDQTFDGNITVNGVNVGDQLNQLDDDIGMRAPITLGANEFDNPNNADWAVNALAPVAADSNNNGLSVRLFDDTVEEGVGYTERIPTDATSVKFTFWSRAETAPGAARTVGLKIYSREIANNVAVGAWDAGVVLDDVDIPANEFFQEDTQTLTLAALGLTAGTVTQFELTRINPTGGTELVGDWALLIKQVEFI